MRVGSLVYATDQGLGYLAKAFYDHGVVTDVFVVEHAHHINRHREWYPSAPSCPIKKLGRERRDVEKFIDSVDVLLFFETPFDWGLIEYARMKGKRTFLMPMYECTPAKLPAEPDFFLCPSLLDLRYFPKRSCFIPVPIEVKATCRRCSGLGFVPIVDDNSKLCPHCQGLGTTDGWKLRTKAEVFVHNAGHGGLRNRNGTGELIDAMKYVKSPIRLILRSQKRLQWAVEYKRVEVRIGTAAREELYEEGDVFVFPEKFNGLSLPLQEAYASGMLVLATDRYPNNQYLPHTPLIPSAGSTEQRIGPAYNVFNEAIVRPQDIAAKIDEWHGRSIESYSQLGRIWGEGYSWSALKPRYLEVLEKGVRPCV